MEDRRRYYSNKLDEEVRQLEIYKQRHEATIVRFKNLENGGSNVRKKITSLKEEIDNYEKNIESKTQEAVEIRAGQRDSELRERVNVEKNSHKTKKREAEHKKHEQQQESQKQKDISEQYYQNTRSEIYNHRKKGWDMKREYKWFTKTCSYIPDYLEAKLAIMPNNRGYIWRNIWLMGHKAPERGQPIIMLERKNKDLLYIHEHDEYESRVYEKRGKNKKVLIKRTPRRPRVQIRF